MSELVYPRLDNTMGAVFVGVMMGAALWGICCMQTTEYFSEGSKNDPLPTKVMVVVLFILNSLHQILFTHVVYIYLITEHFNVAYLGVVVWSLVAQVFVSALIGLIVQTFFVYRIWILSHRKIYIVVVVEAMVLATFCLTLAYFIKAFHVKTFAELPTLLTLSQSVNAMAATSDITIAAVLIFILYTSKTGFSRCDSIINQLILYSLNTGFATSVCAFLSLISINLFPKTLIFITFYIPLSRLYINSLLATLNARRKLRTSNNPSHHSMATETKDVSATIRTTSPYRPDEPHHVAIRIDTETARGYDALSPKKSGYELSVFAGSENKAPSERSV